MDSLDVARQVTQALNELETPYMVVGSLASNAYGVARNTADADFVLETDEHLDRIHARLIEQFMVEPQISFETVQMTTKHVLYHRDTGFKVELFLLSNDAHDRLRFERRRRVEHDGYVTFLPTAEDVIIQKLRWHRRKDIDDVSSVIELQHPNLDWPYILKWCDEHGSREVLDAVLKEIEIEIDE